MALAVARTNADVEVEDIPDADEEIPFKYSISSYGADYTLDSLVRRIGDGSIFVPSFQREYVWNQKQASLLIESFLMGLPVPGIFLSREENQTLLVIDGHQRLRTLQYFYDGIFASTGREFALTGVGEQFKDLTYKRLADEDRRRLDDTILHATIVNQDDPKDDNSSVYLIFERLNTLGVQLLPQEIRNCIYRGQFNDSLKQLNDDQSWRHIFGKVHSRAKDQELILRFLALRFYGDSYSRPMKGFLNTYMAKNRNLEQNSLEEISQAFVPAVDLIYSAVGERAFRRSSGALNAAVFDAVMVATARRLRLGEIMDLDHFKVSYDSLLKDEAFVEDTESSTTDENRVRRRLGLATSKLANVR